MALIDSIINITITRQTAVAKVASFNGVIIVSEFDSSSITPSFDERVRSYTSLSEIATAGFATSSAVYLAAQSLFAQNPNIGEIYVGRKKSVADGGPETWDAALTAIKEASDAWYGLMVDTKTLTDLEDIADWTESNKKLFIISDDDANIIDATGDIAEYAETNNYDRTAVMYHPDADLTTDDPFVEAAWFGLMFTNDPGEATWAYKTLTGVAAYLLSTTQINTAIGKNCNLFQEIASNDVTRFGTVGSGEYLDIIRGVDWLEARIQERVFTVLLNNKKVAYTDAGIQSIVTEVASALQEGVDIGLIAPPDDEGNASYVVTAPRASEVSASDKADRLLPDVEFTATLAGAIHKVTIEGIVSL